MLNRHSSSARHQPGTLLLQHWRPALGLALITLLGFGLVYSLAATSVTAVLFPDQATGSLLTRNGQIIGSRLLAQPFKNSRYFQPRPSAADYDPMKATGSNQARSNPELLQRIARARQDVAARDHISQAAVAADLITQSGSGLDPDISIAAAQQQVSRIALARGLPVAFIQRVLDRHIVSDSFGLAPPHVNVLELNLDLDRQMP